MTIISRAVLLALIAAAACLCLGAAQEKEADHKKPELVLRVAPVIAFVPARIKFSVDIVDGADDYVEFYCASIQWDWDDGTTSEWSRDCEPYRPGKTQFQRHFSAVHNYDIAENYHPTFRLKKREKVVAQVSADIELRPGAPQ
jgi:hypothetical protein